MNRGKQAFNSAAFQYVRFFFLYNYLVTPRNDLATHLWIRTPRLRITAIELHSDGQNDLWANRHCGDECRNNAFLGSTEVLPFTKDSLLIWPTSGLTGKSVFVAQRWRRGPKAVYHTCKYAKNEFLNKVEMFASNNFYPHWNLQTSTTRMVGFKAISIPELVHRTIMSIFSCQ